MQEKQAVLIIEDTKDLVNLLIRRFEHEYAVAYALDGGGGLAMARATSPDLILLDVNLPDMSGFDVLAELKASDLTRDIPVLIMTALSDTENVLRGFKAGAEDYLVKPFNFTELSARVNAHLTIRELQKKLIGIERLNALRELAVGLSHEINNPLMSINTFAHALKMKAGECGDAGEDFVTMLDGIIGEVSRIAGKVKKLSEASRVVTVAYQPGINMVDMSDAE